MENWTRVGGEYFRNGKSIGKVQKLIPTVADRMAGLSGKITDLGRYIIVQNENRFILIDLIRKTRYFEPTIILGAWVDPELIELPQPIDAEKFWLGFLGDNMQTRAIIKRFKPHTTLGGAYFELAKHISNRGKPDNCLLSNLIGKNARDLKRLNESVRGMI